MSGQGVVWVVDDDHAIRWVLEKALRGIGFDVRGFGAADEVLALLPEERPDVMMVDIRMPGVNGLELLKRVGDLAPRLPIIIMTAYADLDSAVAAFQGGAFDYLPKPFDVDEAGALVRRALGHARGEARGEVLGDEASEPEILGRAPAMQEVFRAIGRLARSRMTVLITGETGTGKELVARALHRHSPRAGRPFIALNTAAIPRELLESELFGHERGAFTGAQAQRRGRFEQADGGTLFLDEIGDMPAELQTRLLRVLAEGEFYRVGGHTGIRVDVRIIAATHQDLERRVKEGSFREDLFHRINVIRVHVPALRERREDIPLLVRHFMEQAARELDMTVKTVSTEALERLCALEWPGNVRQLENTCRWISVMAAGSEVQTSDLPRELNADAPASTPGSEWERELRRWAEQRLAQGEVGLATRAERCLERVLIDCALAAAGGGRAEAARLLGWGRNTLTRKLRELGEPPPG